MTVDGFLVDVIEPLFSSPSIYLIGFLFCAIDGFLPLVPSETVVITSVVFADAGRLNVVGVLAVTFAGALVGDCISYGIGRFVNLRLGRRLWRTERRQSAHDWARRQLDRRGGLILVGARFIPGGRTATTLTTGAVEYPFRRFVGFAGLAAALWAGYMALVGYIAGAAVEHDPIKGILLGLGLSVVLSVCVELARRLVGAHRRRRDRKAAALCEDREPADAATLS